MSPAGSLSPLMQRNFMEYASYVNLDRAIPDMRDGCKPVQRRILEILHQMDDGKFNKVANVVGECMKLHPHGDASIYEALVVLANKEYFIERQGNFGSIVTGDGAAAARYIECRLTSLAKETLYNPDLTEYQPSYDGRRKEPVWLPVKLPVTLMLGTDGIGVAMASKILPHNFGELLKAQIQLLRNEPIDLVPDFPTGGIMDPSDYADGRGKVAVRALIEARGDKAVVIKEIPYGTTTESLIASIESASLKGRVKIAEINDYTGEHVEIEISLPRGVYADEVIPQLYAYTDCQVSISSNLTVIRDRRPAELTVSDILHENTLQLRDIIKRELELELSQLADKHHWLTLEQIFIENRVYKRIESETTAEGVKRAVYDGMAAFKHLFIRDMTDADVDRLLEIRIRRISQYDINKNRKDIDDIVRAIGEAERKLKQLTKTTIAWIEGLLKKYGHLWPRRTKIQTVTQVDKRAVARATLKVVFDAETGFLGTEVKGGEPLATMSEYDRLLLICADGSYRIVAAPDKLLLPAKLVHHQIFDQEAGAAFTVVYRDQDRNAFAKRIQLKGFVTGKEYDLIKDRAGKLDLLLPGHPAGIVHCDFVKAPRLRQTECDFDLGTLEPTGAGARGARIAPKPVARVKFIG